MTTCAGPQQRRPLQSPRLPAALRTDRTRCEVPLPWKHIRFQLQRQAVRSPDFCPASPGGPPSRYPGVAPRDRSLKDPRAPKALTVCCAGGSQKRAGTPLASSSATGLVTAVHPLVLGSGGCSRGCSRPPAAPAGGGSGGGCVWFGAGEAEELAATAEGETGQTLPASSPQLPGPELRPAPRHSISRAPAPPMP